MESITIKSNNQWREILFGWDLSEKELAEFDYIDSERIMSHQFIRYKGIVYDLSEFQTISNLPDTNPLKDWQGICSQSYFYGIVIRFDSSCEHVQVGSYCA